MVLDAFLYFGLLFVWSAVVAYFILFRAIPYIRGEKEVPHTVHHHAAPQKSHHPGPKAPRRTYSTHEGFRSLAKGEHLTIDDIVKGLSREL